MIFRPIFLTYTTTVVGLLLLIFDRSLQPQFLIPCSYLAAEEIRGHLGKA